MRRAALATLTIAELVARFEEIALAQDQANDEFRIARYNALFGEMEKVDAELQRRGVEARLALTALYEHPNFQVRLKAAIRTLAVAPERAVAVLRDIDTSDRQPYAHDARFTLRNYNSGFFKPR